MAIHNFCKIDIIMPRHAYFSGDVAVKVQLGEDAAAGPVVSECPLLYNHSATKVLGLTVQGDLAGKF
jgi:hypothetical protein